MTTLFIILLFQYSQKIANILIFSIYNIYLYKIKSINDKVNNSKL
jgi:hypothetical protein